MPTRARLNQKKIERKIYNAKERAERAKRYYDSIKKDKSRGRT